MCVLQASVLLQHICKAGNGSIPKPPKRESNTGNKKGRERGSYQQDTSLASASDPQAVCSAEEKLAR